MPGPLHYWAHGLSAYHGAWYNGEQVETGKVFPLAGAINDYKLVDLRYLVPVPDYAKLVTCSACHARFLDESSWNQHATRRHGPEARAVPDAVEHSQQTPPITAAACSHERVQGAETGTKKHTRRPYYDKETLEAEIKEKYPPAAHEQGGHVSLRTMARMLKIPVTEKTLSRYLRTYNIPYPPH